MLALSAAKWLTPHYATHQTVHHYYWHCWGGGGQSEVHKSVRELCCSPPEQWLCSLAPKGCEEQGCGCGIRGGVRRQACWGGTGGLCSRDGPVTVWSSQRVTQVLSQKGQGWLTPNELSGSKRAGTPRCPGHLAVGSNEGTRLLSPLSLHQMLP